MRKKFIAGNWKMNCVSREAEELVEAVAGKLMPSPQIDILICPAFTVLAKVRDRLKGSPIKLGAQNMHWESKGAFTGEVSASMLKDCGCEYVILGHSERRHVMGETDEMINKKLSSALVAGLIPILCVGETLQEREANRARDVVERQIEKATAQIGSQDIQKTIVAYEPVWAIGTGKNATPAEAQEMHRCIRKHLERKYETAIAGDARILYGGSVKPDNARDILLQEDVDGFLVGGASIDANAFLKILSVGNEIGSAGACPTRR